MTKTKIAVILFFMVVLVSGLFSYSSKKQDEGNGHCEAMKDNPPCNNNGVGTNGSCGCIREPDESGNCPIEGKNCKNHCCRKKCRCYHPKCTLTLNKPDGKPNQDYCKLMGH